MHGKPGLWDSLRGLASATRGQSAGDTFQWLLEPPGHSIEGLTWYIDGSLFDEYKRYARRTGFGIVVVSSDGSLVGLGNGVPPDWIVDAAGAELWALYSVAALDAELPMIVTDCKGLLDTLRGVPASACAHDKALARTWNMLRHILDDDFTQGARQVRWMPSHTSAHAIGSVPASDGQYITATMWRANRLADALAKAAASENRLPKWVPKIVALASKWVKHQAAKLGAITHAANNFVTVSTDEDGSTITRTRRDSVAERPAWIRRKPKCCTKVEPACSSTAPPVLSGILAAPGGRDAAEAEAIATVARQRRSGHKKKKYGGSDLAAGVRYRKKRAQAATAQLKVDLADEAQVAGWLAARSPAKASRDDAADRMAALRARIRQKQARATSADML